MNSDEIRRRTVYVIRKDGEYLVGTILYSTDLRWSASPYDAWGTRSRVKAERVASVTGGELWLFNPITGRKRKNGD